MTRPHRLVFAALALAPLQGCPQAQITDIEPQTGLLDAQGTVYGAFSNDAELLEGAMLSLVETATTYADAGEEGCFQLPELRSCDIASLCVDYEDTVDLTGAISLAHADWLVGPPTRYLGALTSDNWATTFPSTYDNFELGETTDKAAFEAEEKNFYAYSYVATIDAVLTQFTIQQINQIRRIPDWQGSGQPLIAMRGYLAQPGESTMENASMSQLWTIELLVPSADGQNTLRVMATWNGLAIGDADVNSLFGSACGGLKGNYPDLCTWSEQQGNEGCFL